MANFIKVHRCFRGEKCGSHAIYVNVDHIQCVYYDDNLEENSIDFADGGLWTVETVEEILALIKEVQQ